jgi:CIC family chloride channel protein
MLEQQPVKSEANSFRKLQQLIREYIDRVQPPDSLVLVVTALFVGVGTGLGAVVFVWALQEVGGFVTWLQNEIGDIIGLLVAMGLAGLLVGYMVDRWAKEAKGHGVPEVMEAIALRNGRIRPRVAALKVLASSLTIGTGGSAGREGPIVQVGSALGSTLGQLFHFSAERVKTLVACGAAAGIAATFNAPIAGSIFALEVILGRFTVRYFGAVVISSVSASIIARIYLSDKPAFDVPAYPFQPSELPLYALLGVLAALVAVLFIRLLYWFENLFDEWSWHPALKGAIGMLLTAAVALTLPGREILGPGLHFIGETIAEDISLSVGLMLALLLLKLLATCFTLGSGNSGGVFAPGLFMGALVGGILGTIAHGLWPDLARNPGAYAIVGMAAVFSSAARAPITAFSLSSKCPMIINLSSPSC